MWCPHEHTQQVSPEGCWPRSVTFSPLSSKVTLIPPKTSARAGSVRDACCLLCLTCLGLGFDSYSSSTMTRRSCLETTLRQLAGAGHRLPMCRQGDKLRLLSSAQLQSAHRSLPVEPGAESSACETCCAPGPAGAGSGTAWGCGWRRCHSHSHI